MMRALDVAAWLLHENRERRVVCGAKPLQHSQLQALLVAAQQGFWLYYRELLFADRIQRWRYGPIVPAVYRVVQQKQGVLPSVPELRQTEDNFLFSIYESFAHEPAAAVLAPSRALWEPLGEGAILDPTLRTPELLCMFGMQGK